MRRIPILCYIRHAKPTRITNYYFTPISIKRQYHLDSYKTLKTLIIKHTQVTTEHMTPEIKLQLITKECCLWHAPPKDNPFADPFWAFYWPGGQALARFILDNCDIFKDKKILDVGSGCGASAIASIMSGAKTVLANDIDEVALVAIDINAALNNVKLKTDSSNLIGEKENHWDIVLLGDMFYDTDFCKTVFDWIKKISHNTRVFIGDPGRLSFKSNLEYSNLGKVAEYELPENCKIENYGLTQCCVWEFKLGKFC